MLTLLFAFALAQPPAPAARPDLGRGPIPVAVWIDSDSGDAPRLAVYDDGTFICRVETGHVVSHYPREMVESLRRHLRRFGPLSGLRPRYSMNPGATDLSTARLYVDLGSEAPLATEVYGLSDGYFEWLALTDQTPPLGVIAVQGYLSTRRCHGGQPWTPEYIEVRLWPAEGAPGSATSWPKEWPGLDSEAAVSHGRSFSIFLPGTMRDQVRRVLRLPWGPVEVLLAGKRWTGSVRDVFPSETKWRQAFPVE